MLLPEEVEIPVVVTVVPPPTASVRCVSPPAAFDVDESVRV